VNPDVCFAEAGFTDFGDADGAWDAEADAWLQRVLDAMAAPFGTATLCSPPLHQALPWYRRLVARPQPLPLWQQLAEPLHDDRLPAVEIRFDEGPARIRGGAGHLLLWIDWPAHSPMAFEAFAVQVAAGHPLLQTDLQWATLWPGVVP
jgi:hypothetical protein